MYSNLIPVFTGIFSFILGIEVLSSNKILGIVMVVVGLIFAQLKKKEVFRKNVTRENPFFRIFRISCFPG